MVGGNGLVILTADNGYTGDTTIAGGTLQIGNGTSGADSLASQTVSDSGVLAFNHSDGLSLFGHISGPGSVVKSGTGHADSPWQRLRRRHDHLRPRYCQVNNSNAVPGKPHRHGGRQANGLTFNRGPGLGGPGRSCRRRILSADAASRRPPP